MARGRTITTFGQAFDPFGISHGSQPVVLPIGPVVTFTVEVAVLSQHKVHVATESVHTVEVRGAPRRNI